MTKRPTQQEVFDWMAQTGHGTLRASRHFGLSHGTVKGWVQRARERSRRIVSHETQSEKRAKRAKGARVVHDKWVESRARANRLAEQTRTAIQTAIANGLAPMSDAEWVKTHAQDYANLARGVRALVEIGPDILALPEKLTPASTDNRQAAADLAAAMQVDAEERPQLTIVVGDRASSS